MDAKLSKAIQAAMRELALNTASEEELDKSHPLAVAAQGLPQSLDALRATADLIEEKCEDVESLSIEDMNDIRRWSISIMLHGFAAHVAFINVCPNYPHFTREGGGGAAG